MDQKPWFSSTCFRVCSWCSVFSERLESPGLWWNRLAAWLLCFNTGDIVGEVLTPGEVSPIMQCLGGILLLMSPKFAHWSICKQNQFRLPPYGALFVYHLHIFCTPENVFSQPFFITAKTERAALISRLKSTKAALWSGDGRFDCCKFVV